MFFAVFFQFACLGLGSQVCRFSGQSMTERNLLQCAENQETLQLSQRAFPKSLNKHSPSFFDLCSLKNVLVVFNVTVSLFRLRDCPLPCRVARPDEQFKFLSDSVGADLLPFD